MIADQPLPLRPPTMLDINSPHVPERERVFSCPHVVVTLVPETLPATCGGANWVLVKGHHDSGTICGVYGPHSEETVDWLLREMLDCSSYNWTKVKLGTVNA